MNNPQDHKVTSRRHWWLMAIALVMTLGWTGPVTAADSVKQKPVEASGPANVSKKGMLYDIDATGTDIKFVVEALAQCSGVNIVVSPEIAGPVTAHLKQMSVDAILDCVSTVQGFTWRKSGDTYMLLGNKAKEQDAKPVAVQPDEQLLVWQCKHIKPADVVTTLQGLFPKLKVLEGPGAETPVITQQSGGSASGFTGGGATSTSSTQGGTAGVKSTVLIYGDKSDVAKANEALAQMDKARAQVLIKVAVTEVNSDASKELGIDWAYGDIVLTEAAESSAIRFGKLTREPMSFTGAISALIKSGSGKLLAEPNITVIDGESASVLIGDRILFPKVIGYSTNGTPIYDKEEERVGIYLQLAAKACGDDEMILTVYPQVSLVTSFLKTKDADYPQISTREARTTVRVKNGATLSIGGLIRDDDIKSITKVPLLGDLPVIGQFFRRNKTTRARTEIVILLTPTLLSED